MKKHVLRVALLAFACAAGGLVLAARRQPRNTSVSSAPPPAETMAPEAARHPAPARAPRLADRGATPHRAASPAAASPVALVAATRQEICACEDRPCLDAARTRYAATPKLPLDMADEEAYLAEARAMRPCIARILASTPEPPIP
jgi:hypothetical protein